MLYVKAVAAGVWRHAPFNPPRDWERTLVVANEAGKWCVNRLPVDVFPGVIVGFDEPDEANFFLASGRGLVATPDPAQGHTYAFENDHDAHYFVRQGLGVFVSEEDVKAEYERRLASLRGSETDDFEAEDDTDETDTGAEDEGSKMLKDKIENKSVKGAAETKKAASDGKKAAKPAGKAKGKS